jgi:ankyrin repeat protein
MLHHDADQVRAAAEQRDDAGKTALHFACQNVPPKDVIDVFLSVANDIVQWPDSFGWLPIHYACAYGADTTVIKSLADAFPESKTKEDRKGRTPLHFALGTANSNSPAVVVLLSSTGAASYADDNGMLVCATKLGQSHCVFSCAAGGDLTNFFRFFLFFSFLFFCFIIISRQPLHYACAYGASEEALYVLTDAYLDAITTPDRRGRTPLHFALSNAGRKAAPAAVRLLLSLNRELVNSMNGGPLPLRVLAEYAATIKKDEEQQRESVESCLKYLLAAKPDPTADFFTALQSLPPFLQEKLSAQSFQEKREIFSPISVSTNYSLSLSLFRAVVMKVVQELLNEKIAQRFPTAILLLDFYLQMIVVIFYTLAVQETANIRYGGQTNVQNLSFCIPLLFLGATYFLVREIIQVFSLLSLHALHIWVYEPGNWLSGESFCFWLLAVVVVVVIVVVVVVVVVVVDYTSLTV